MTTPADANGQRIGDLDRAQKKGGSWDTEGLRTRSAFQDTHDKAKGEGDLGFRVCVDAY